MHDYGYPGRVGDTLLSQYKADVRMQMTQQGLLRSGPTGKASLAAFHVFTESDETRQLWGRTQGSTSLRAYVARTLASAVPFLSGIS